MSSCVQAEAVVLTATPFKDYDRILTLFSPQGLLKIFVKVSKRNYLQTAALISPLTRAEFHYTLGRKDLHRFTEGKILAQHLRIRDRFETLTAAETMIRALLSSQWPGKPAPKLYHLFQMLLEHLPQVGDPTAVVSIFLIKILSHEGILHVQSPAPTHRFGGERYSAPAAPPGAQAFSLEDEALLTHIALSRSLTQMSTLTFPETFHTKVSVLFSQAFN